MNLKDETVWLNLEQMTELFKRDKSVISRHIKNALVEELKDEQVVAKFATTTKHGAIEEKGANFLYLIVKNHVFTDGNKRIAATLFIYFLNFYDILYKKGKQTIDNNTLTALTLLIAESNPKEKEIIIGLVMNFLNNEN